MYRVSIFLVSLWLLLSACQPKKSVCPAQEEAAQPTLDLSQLVSITATPGPSPTPAVVEIAGNILSVDKVVQGPLCNDDWNGTIYVGCDVQVAQWEEQPTFFKDCSLTIQPGTVVYVADHNDAAYYKGCSCHTGELTQEY